MKKFFNVSGPCYPDQHYMLPAQERCQGLPDLIDHNQYFVIHAARQTGKTTLLLDLTQQLNAAGQYYALYCSLESVDQITEAEKGIPAILRVLKTQIKFSPLLKRFPFAAQAVETDFNTVLREALSYFCAALDKPLVICFDEIDCLANGTLLAFLRQLREGYINRGPIPFVHAIALVGMRNIRDYKSRIRADRETLGSASPFNIVKTAATLRNFTQAEIAALYQQHTDVTGQEFSAEVVASVYRATEGQPWLVNAIACEIVEQLLPKDMSQPITPEHVAQAVQTMILRRPTHIDSLMERLREERVKKIVEPVILGEMKDYEGLDDDYRYVLDLGLLREAEHRRLIPANPIYGEIIMRTLSFRSQMEMEQQQFPPEAPAYLVAGRLDMRRLLSDFQQFWREHSDIWVKKYEYREAAPHLILQAFLQRIINARGQVTREMAAGSGRLDLCVHYQDIRYPLELKLRYSQKTYQEGQQQLAAYMETLGCAEGWLLVFDRRKSVSWQKKIFWKTHQIEGKTIHTVGC